MAPGGAAALTYCLPACFGPSFVGWRLGDVPIEDVKRAFGIVTSSKAFHSYREDWAARAEGPV